MIRLSLLLLVSLYICTPSETLADFGELVRRLPADANVLTLVDAERLVASDAYQSSVRGGVPPIAAAKGVAQYASASRWRLPSDESVYETTLVRLTNASAADIVERAGRAEQDTLLPAESIAIAVEPNLLGIYQPRDPQAASRWVSQSSGVQPSAYLGRAVGYTANAGTAVIFAIDTTDSLTRRSMQTWIDGEPFAGSKLLPADAAGQLAGLQGATLGVSVGDTISGRWRFDFDNSPGSLVPQAPGLMTAMLQAIGMGWDPFDGWQTTVDGNSLLMGGPIDLVQLRQMLMVMADVPVNLPMAATGQRLTAGGSGSVDNASTASKAYYDRLSGLLHDITHPEHSLITAGARAHYLDRYARGVDRLPILNVDPMLIDLAADVATRLRVQASRTRGNLIEAGTYSHRTNVSNNDTVDWYSGYGLSDAQVAANMARATSAKDGYAQKAQIADRVAEVRRAMTQKYSIEF